jgi:hypothetical protein
MKKMFLIVVALLAISAPAFAAEWLTNGNFETDTAAPADPFVTPTGWTRFLAISNMTDITSIKGGTTFGAYSDGNSAYPATWTMAPINATKDCYISLRGGDGNGAEGGIYQQVNLNPGTYTLSGMVSTLNHNIGTAGGNYYLWEIGIIAGAWGNLNVPLYGGSGQRVPEYQPTAPRPEFGIWGAKQVQTGGAVALTSLGHLPNGPQTNQINVTTAGTYTVYVMLGVNCAQNPTEKSRFKLRVDDLSLSGTPIPEPGSLLALGTGLIGLVGFIRRRR